MRLLTFSLLLLLVAAVPAAAQDVSASDPTPAADAADVASIEAILTAVYDVISGPAGPRDWDRFASLFAPGARLIPIAHPDGGSPALRPMTPAEFAERSEPFFQENGFFETEVARAVETYGHLAHAFSTYESRATPDAEPFDRGINSFQLFHDGTRWWVVSIYWDSERAGHPIPDRYLGE